MGKLKSKFERNRFIILVLTSVCILTSCGDETSSQSDELISWDVPAALDSQAVYDLIPSENILTEYLDFARFDGETLKIEPVSGLTDVGKPFTSPENCRESDAFLTQRTFVKSSYSSASDYMKQGWSWSWGTSDPNDTRQLTITIVGDSNTGENFLLNDIATELQSCGTVVNSASTLTWSVIQSFTQPAPEILRVDYKILWSKSNVKSRKGLVLARQSGRNVIYVSYARDGLGLTSNFPISGEIEDQMNLLLDDINSKLNL